VGNVLWLRVYSAGNESHGNDLTELPDSSLLMVGLGQGLNVDGYALKTDKDGNFQFTKNEVAAAFNEFTSVHLFSAGAVMLSGQIINPFISLTDTACSSFCNIAPYTVLESVPAYADTQVTVTTVNLPFSEDTLQVIYTAHPLTRHVLCGFTSAKENIFQNEIEVYPNPIADKLNITINNGLAEIILCDVASRKLLQQKFTNSVSLNTAQLARGIYLYEVRGTNGLIKKGKVVKE
jgi:hypothetical protein